MKNEVLIKALRHCGEDVAVDCHDCPLRGECDSVEYPLSHAADAIEELQKALDAVNDAHNEGYDVGYWAGRRDYEPKWIHVTERLPELDQEVLVYAIGKVDGFGDSVIAMSKRHIFRLFSSSEEGVEVWTSPWPYFSSNYEITHWMPLPDAPKGEQE